MFLRYKCTDRNGNYVLCRVIGVSSYSNCNVFTLIKWLTLKSPWKFLSSFHRTFLTFAFYFSHHIFNFSISFIIYFNTINIIYMSFIPVTFNYNLSFVLQYYFPPSSFWWRKILCQVLRVHLVSNNLITYFSSSSLICF